MLLKGLSLCHRWVQRSVPDRSASGVSAMSMSHDAGVVLTVANAESERRKTDGKERIILNHVMMTQSGA